MTSTWRNREELEHQIVTLATAGTSRRAITRAMGVSRNTVKRVLAKHRAQRAAAHSALAAPKQAPRPKKIDAFADRVRELFKRYPDITAQRVFEILKGEGFDGGYTAVKAFVRTARPGNKPAPSLVAPSYGPGEMAESDWSSYTIKFTSGERLTVQAFSYVLTFSPRKFFAVFLRSDLHALLDGHGRCQDSCRIDAISGRTTPSFAERRWNRPAAGG